MQHSSKMHLQKSQIGPRQVSDLKRSFESYRAGNPNVHGRRIPQELRQAVVQALQAGLSPRDIMVACRVSKNQLELWQRERRRPSTGCVVEDKAEARVLQVKDAMSPGLAAESEQKLEVRLGRWRLELRWGKADGWGQ